MERLNKTELGQFNDKRVEEIKEDFENSLKGFLEKWQHIDNTDLQAVCFSQFGWLFAKSHLEAMGRVMEEKGYKSSSEAKTIKFIEQIL